MFEAPSDINFARYVARPAAEKLSHAVVEKSWGMAEEKKLGDSIDKIKALSERLGESSWESGFDIPKDVAAMQEMTEYGQTNSTGVEGVAEKRETVRQYCYQFVRLAEHYQAKYADMKYKYDRIKERVLDLLREETDE